MMPGTASALTRHSATKKPWITSSAVVSILTPSPIGSSSVFDWKPPSLTYVNVHWYCAPVASTTRSLVPAWATDSLSCRSMPAQMPKKVTISTGIVVQKISRPVCPWIGAPSRMSSGPRRRNVMTQYAITIITRPKMAPET